MTKECTPARALNTWVRRAPPDLTDRRAELIILTKWDRAVRSA